MENILHFFSTNKDSMTAIGVILTLLVSVISLYFSIRNNRAVHYVNAITKNRVEWLRVFREYMANYMYITTSESIKVYVGDENGYRKHISEIEQLKNLIRMHLNFASEIDSNIDICVNNIIALHKDLYELESFCSKDKIEQRIYTELMVYSVGRRIISSYFGKEYVDGEMLSNIRENECTRAEFMNYLAGEIVRYNDNEEVYRNELLRHVRVYLKFEWNRIKVEATGKRYKKHSQIKDINELYRLYDEDYKKCDSN